MQSVSYSVEALMKTTNFNYKKWDRRGAELHHVTDNC